MKNQTSFPTKLYFGILCSMLLFSSKVKAQKEQESAILAVMRAKTEAYFAGNLEKWQSFWLQDSTISRTVISKFDYETEMGFGKIKATIIEKIKAEKPTPLVIRYENQHSRIEGKMAFVEADEVYLQPSDAKFKFMIHTYTVLVNKNKAWKITNQIRLDIESYNNKEEDLNTLGYDFLKDKNVNSAIEVFKLNAKLFPNSWNVFDSLGDAYVQAGEKKLAIENFEKALEINPKSEESKRKLAELKLK